MRATRVAPFDTAAWLLLAPGSVGAVTVVLPGCDDASDRPVRTDVPPRAPSAPTQPGAPIPPGPSLFGAFDPQAEMAALQGTWKVRDAFGMKTPAVWRIEGNRLTRTEGDKTKQAEVKVAWPGVLVVGEEERGGSMRTYLAYARDGGRLWIGLGTGGAHIGDLYVVADDGAVIFDGKTCKHHRKRMRYGGGAEFEDGHPVKCGLREAEGRRLFEYQVPDKFNAGQLVQKAVTVHGAALVDEQLEKDHEVVSAAPPPSVPGATTAAAAGPP